jgi:hypothetical protein
MFLFTLNMAEIKQLHGICVVTSLDKIATGINFQSKQLIRRDKGGLNRFENCISYTHS